MNVHQLIANLTFYASQSPENGHAAVKILLPDGVSYDIEKGEDARGVSNEHFLLLIPHMATGIGVRAMRKM